MSVRPRGKSFEACFYHNEKRYRRSFQTSAEALQWEREAQARLVLGVGVPEAVPACVAKDGIVTLQRLFTRIQEAHWNGSKGEDTATTNTKNIEEILGPTIPVSEIKTEHVDRLIEKLKATGNSNATINRKLSALRFALKYASQRSWLKTMPVIPRLKENQGRLRFLSDEEEARVLEYFRVMGEKDMLDLVQWLLDTGMRLGEALRCHPEDINFKSDTVVVPERKGGLPGGIPLTSRLVKIAHERTVTGVRLFSALSNRKAQFRWDLCRTHLGLENDEQFVLHCLRHTCASRLVQRGAELYVVQKWLGHASITMTQRYAHLRPDDLHRVKHLLETEQTSGYTKKPSLDFQSGAMVVAPHVAKVAKSVAVQGG